MAAWHYGSVRLQNSTLFTRVGSNSYRHFAFNNWETTCLYRAQIVTKTISLLLLLSFTAIGLMNSQQTDSLTIDMSAKL
jgi:hypothetical protein